MFLYDNFKFKVISLVFCVFLYHMVVQQSPVLQQMHQSNYVCLVLGTVETYNLSNDFIF